MFSKCLQNVRTISKQCFENVCRMSQESGKCVRNVKGMSGLVSEDCLGGVSRISEESAKCLKNI